MYELAGENELDLEALRAKLRRMSDDALNRFGQAARYICSPAAKHARRKQRVFVIKLRQAVKGRRRRHRDSLR